MKLLNILLILILFIIIYLCFTISSPAEYFVTTNVDLKAEYRKAESIKNNNKAIKSNINSSKSYNEVSPDECKLKLLPDGWGCYKNVSPGWDSSGHVDDYYLYNNNIGISRPIKVLLNDTFDEALQKAITAIPAANPISKMRVNLNNINSLKNKKRFYIPPDSLIKKSPLLLSKAKSTYRTKMDYVYDSYAKNEDDKLLKKASCKYKTILQKIKEQNKKTKISWTKDIESVDPETKYNDELNLAIKRADKNNKITKYYIQVP